MKSALKLPLELRLVIPLSAVLVAECSASGDSGNPGAASRTPTATASAGIPGCAPECLSGGVSVAPEGSWDLHRVLFWSDLVPVGKDRERAAGVPSTAPKLVAWLRSRPNLRVSEPRSGTIGTDALPAQVVDIAVSGKAVNEASDCPARACADFLTWPNSGDNVYGIAEPAVLRLYLSDVGYGGRTHLFAIGIEGRDQADLKALLPDAEKLIAGADAPVSPTPS